jgi:hypothetical protein
MVHDAADDAARLADELIAAGVEPAPAELAGARHDSAILAGQRVAEEIVVPAVQDVHVPGPAVAGRNRGLIGEAGRRRVLARALASGDPFEQALIDPAERGPVRGNWATCSSIVTSAPARERASPVIRPERDAPTMTAVPRRPRRSPVGFIPPCLRASGLGRRPDHDLVDVDFRGLLDRERDRARYGIGRNRHGIALLQELLAHLRVAHPLHELGGDESG